ncbi:hypothetical protein PIROE2DRAFT_10591 [Piromyces sp. E2]|nr:hypothetical protein PIROE2DRAFT_10591 [Piromyces sp. E2]|eukprot:OUM62963.1 hypothetical protein PIROE2DRAFT_10591 [Piromyces sp. E2]
MKFVNLFISALTLISATYAGNVRWAGFRYSTYGVQKSFGYSPSASNVNKYVQALKQGIDKDAKGTLLLTVGKESNKNKCLFEFPNSGSSNSKNIKFSSEDKFEDILSKCDKNDINVWLVVEPGSNDLVKLANIVLNKYGSHKSVKGFGVDLERWYRGNSDKGKALSDSEAERVIKAIRERNENYTFLAKHRETSYMPKYYIDGMIYVDTAQSFSNLNQMTKEFTRWANTFSNNPVMFEVGYQSDKKLWKNEPAGIANEIANRASQYNKNVGIIWADFTMKDVLKKI